MKESEKKYDVIIIGGGVAGISAALWCAELSLSAVILEKEAEFGGQLLKIYNRIENHLGINAENGVNLRDVFLKQTENRAFIRRLQTEVLEVDAADKQVTLKTGEKLTAKAIIIAIGVRRRKLAVENEDFYEGKGIIASGKNEQNKVAEKTVLIVGGGDAAIENALILAETAKKVFVAHRRSEFRARREFLVQAETNPKVEFLTETVVENLIGTENLEAARLKNTKTGETKNLKIDRLLIRIGVQPNSELFRGKLDLDKAGYVKINAGGETSADFIFAAGDIANPHSPTVSTAAGTGATAAKIIFAKIASTIEN